MAISMDWRGRLGVPYQGSKNSIARDIIGIMPRGKRFVDLFAGGCAVTHAAMISGKYDSFLANDLQGFGLRLFVDAITGRCAGKWREWVTLDEFNARKAVDPLVALCWSFGNNGRDYLYARTKEAAKHEEHRRRLQGIVSADRELEHIERLQALESLQALERLQAVERLQANYGSYADYQHADGDVVYCDPPYANTQRYNSGAFDNAAFWDWVRTRDYPVFVSEYAAPEGFTPVWQKGKCQLMHANGGAGKVVEYVFVASRYAPQFQTDLFLGM